MQSAQFVHVDQPGHREPDRLRHAGPRQLIGHDQPDAIPRIAPDAARLGAIEDTPGCRQQFVAPQRPVELSLYLADDGFPPLHRHQQIPFTPGQRQAKRRQSRLPRQFDPSKPGIGQGQAVGMLTGDFMDKIGVGFGGRVGASGWSAIQGLQNRLRRTCVQPTQKVNRC